MLLARNKISEYKLLEKISVSDYLLNLEIYVNELEAEKKQIEALKKMKR